MLQKIHLNFFLCSQLILLNFTLIGQSEYRELNDIFSDYEMVEINTFDLVKQIKSANQSEVSIKVLGWSMKLTRSNIISSNYKTSVLSENGLEYVNVDIAIPLKGYTEKGGQVSITIGNDFVHGFIKTGMYVFYIEPLYHFVKGAPKGKFVLYNVKDIKPGQEKLCGVTTAENNKNRVRTQNGARTVQNGGCFEVEWAIASDYSMYNHYGSETDVVNHNVGVANNIQANYDDEFADNIQFEIVEQYIVTVSGGDPWTSSTNSDTLLDSFRLWAPGGFSVTHDMGSLWTRRTLDMNVVGIAYVGAICTNFRYNVLSDFTSNAAQKRVMVAHEIGHNFDADHDAFGAPYIMAPSVNTSNDWSALSISDIEAHYNSRSCLDDCPPLVSEIYFLESESFVFEQSLSLDSVFCGSAYSLVSIPVQLSLAANTANIVDVQISTSSTASENFDFILRTPTLEFPAGVVSTQFIELLVSDDAIQEPIDTLILTLVSVSGPSGIGVNDTHTLHIEDALDVVSDQCCSEGDVITYGNANFGVPYVFTSFWEDGRSRFLYLPSQLSSAGLTEGYIDGLSFFVFQKNSTHPFENFRIGAENVNMTTLVNQSWISTNQYYSGTVTTTVSSWNKIEFDSLFYWDGTSSIYFEFCFDNTVYSGNDLIVSTNPVGGGTGRYVDAFFADGASGCTLTNASINYGNHSIQPQIRFHTLVGALPENNLGKSRTTPIQSGEIAHMYSDDKKIIATIKNIGSTDLSCLQTTVASTGNMTENIQGSNLSYSQKTIHIESDENSLYEVSLYFDNDYMNVWGTHADKLNFVKSNVEFDDATIQDVDVFRPDSIYNNFGSHDLWVYKGTFSGSGWFALTDSILPIKLNISNADLVFLEPDKGVILKNKSNSNYLVSVDNNGMIISNEINSPTFKVTFDEKEWGITDVNYSVIFADIDGDFHKVVVNNAGELSTSSIPTLPSIRLENTLDNLFLENIGSALVLNSPDNSCWRLFINEDGAIRTVRILCP